MFTIRKKFRFEMAHILREAYTKVCSDTIHGHSYVLEIFFRGEELNSAGMVIDFGEIKNKIQKIVDALDHALLIPKGIEHEAYWKDILPLNKKAKMVDFNPTAEEMAREIFYQIQSISKKMDVLLYKVRLHETETGYAEYQEEE